jgi:hypothetical protein
VHIGTLPVPSFRTVDRDDGVDAIRAHVGAVAQSNHPGRERRVALRGVYREHVFDSSSLQWAPRLRPHLRRGAYTTASDTIHRPATFGVVGALSAQRSRPRSAVDGAGVGFRRGGLTAAELSGERVDEFLVWQRAERRYRSQWSRPLAAGDVTAAVLHESEVLSVSAAQNFVSGCGGFGVQFRQGPARRRPRNADQDKRSPLSYRFVVGTGQLRGPESRDM